MSIEIEILNGDASWPLAQPLMEAVWPPHVLEKLPWGDVVFAHADLRVLVQSEDQGLACHVGIYRREVTWNGRKMRAGGIGGVATREDCRSQGYASIALNAAIHTLTDEGATDFGMLFCEPHNRRRDASASRRLRRMFFTSAARRYGVQSTYAACRGDLCVAVDPPDQLGKMTG